MKSLCFIFMLLLSCLCTAFASPIDKSPDGYNIKESKMILVDMQVSPVQVYMILDEVSFKASDHNIKMRLLRTDYKIPQAYNHKDEYSILQYFYYSMRSSSLIEYTNENFKPIKFLRNGIKKDLECYVPSRGGFGHILK